MCSKKTAVSSEPFSETLLNRARKGDRQSLNELAEQIVNYLRAAIIYLQRQGDWQFVDLDDATIEVCLKVCGKLHSFRGSGAFSGWLRRILMNYLKDEERKRQAERNRMGIAVSIDQPINQTQNDDKARTLADILPGSDGNEAINELFDDDDETFLAPAALVHDFLAICNNPKHADVFHLRHIAGCKQREIAEKTAFPLGTIGVLLKRMEEKFAKYVKARMKTQLQ